MPLSRVVRVVAIIVFAAAACNAYTSVRDVIQYSPCQLSLLEGIAEDILTVTACAKSGSGFNDVDDDDLVFFNGLETLQHDAANDLEDAARDGTGQLPVSYGALPLPMTLALKTWATNGQCGLNSFWSNTLQLGNSLLEVGAGIKISNVQTWKPYLQDHGWAQTSTADYFTHDSDYDPSDGVAAFQALYNNKYSDDLRTDGVLDSNTKTALLDSPAGGWSSLPSCGTLRAQLRPSGSSRDSHSDHEHASILGAVLGSVFGATGAGGAAAGIIILRRRYLRKKGAESAAGHSDGTKLGDIKTGGGTTPAAIADTSTESNPALV